MTTRSKSMTLLFAGLAVLAGAACTVTSGTVDDTTPTTNTPTKDGGDGEGGSDGGGNGDAATADGGTCSLGFDFTGIGPQCNECAGANCCEAVNKCADDADRDMKLGCAGYTQCFNGCQTDTLGEATPADCVTKYCDANAATGTIDLFNAWNTCLDDKCKAECPAGG